MSHKIVFMFSGQGSQYYRMGIEYFENIPRFRERMLYLDEIVIHKLGISIVDSLYGPNRKQPDRFDEILITHPGLFMIQHSIAWCLIDDGIQPNCLLGCSLGEAVSIALSEVLPPEQVLEILVDQAILFRQRCSRGGMIAILDTPQLFQDNQDWFTDCEIAGFNFPNHFCISGEKDALEAAEDLLRRNNCIYERLPIQQPFHSQFLEPIKTEFISTFKGRSFSAGKIPTISSMSTTVVENYSAEFMYDVVRKPILFYETIKSTAVDNNIIYIDLGPSGTLSNFVKYSLGKETHKNIFSIMSPLGNNLPKYHQIKNQLNGLRSVLN